MSKDSSAKYYQKKTNKQKKDQDCSKQEKDKQNLVANGIEIFLTMRNKGWLTREKKYKIWNNKTALQIKTFCCYLF